MADRRAFLTFLTALPLAAAGAMPGLARAPQPRIRRIAATPTRKVEVAFWSATRSRVGTIAFSHDFRSAPHFYPAFIAGWTGAGYDIVAPVHGDCAEHLQAQTCAELAAWAARIEDMRAVSAMIGGPYVAAGHGFGALTALALGGVQTLVPEGVTSPLADPAARAIIALSPPAPLLPLVPETGFSGLDRPALIQAGTRAARSARPDERESWRAHFAAFARAPTSGDCYGLVLDGADHTFGGLIGDPARTGPDQRSALNLAVKASLAFASLWGAGRGASARSDDTTFPVSNLARLYKK